MKKEIHVNLAGVRNTNEMFERFYSVFDFGPLNTPNWDAFVDVMEDFRQAKAFAKSGVPREGVLLIVSGYRDNELDDEDLMTLSDILLGLTDSDDRLDDVNFFVQVRAEVE